LGDDCGELGDRYLLILLTCHFLSLFLYIELGYGGVMKRVLEKDESVALSELLAKSEEKV
jgi:hypothetical protein